jgi:drug/metabolite transporter (DMT)-like permease
MMVGKRSLLGTCQANVCGLRLERVFSVKTPGILLIVVGLTIVVWGAFGFKTRDKVLDVGPIHATKETTHNIPYGPLAGAILAIGGVVLLAKSKA